MLTLSLLDRQLLRETFPVTMRTRKLVAAAPLPVLRTLSCSIYHATVGQESGLRTDI
jgi:hypothetical protein